MCGIAGFYGFEDQKLIEKISDEIAHRGPDGQGQFSDQLVTLLNRRLAIIDLKTGDQPKYNDDKSIIVIYNGEIYNYRELREQLKKKNHKFSTESDTEVIVRGYEEWGDQCFDRFNGMFAIALYDKNKHKLILVRDHFGIKPLYYSIIGQKLIFCSEIKPIVSSDLIKKVPNDKTIYRYLKYRVHDDQPETFFANVKKLMPGEMLTVDKNGIQIKSFTNLQEELKNFKPKKINPTDSTVKEFKEKFINAVKLRLISDVPVGTCLSGGLDSSTVVSAINQLLKKKIQESNSIGKIQQTFSAVFPGYSNDEERYIDDLLKETSRVRNFKVKPQARTFIKELEEFVKVQEEPTISTGPYAQYKVMEEAAKHVTVVLDGQGSDEMLAGYDPYFFVYLKQLINEKNYFKFIAELFFARDIVFKYLQLKLRSFFGLRREIEPEKVLNSNFTTKYSNEKFKIINNNLRQRLIEDVFYNSLPSLLRYEDKNSMKFSIEGRVPFLDTNLIKFIFSLPDRYFINNGWNKKILRAGFTALLPKSIAKRRNKIGFTTPEEKWFRQLTNEIYSILLSESFANRKYFDRPAVLRAFELFIEGKNNDTLLFWRLVNLEIWLRIFFDEKKETEAGKKVKSRITTARKTYERHFLKTDLFEKGDNYIKKVSTYVLRFKRSTQKKWLVVISEKIIAVAQGRSYFLWEIRPGFWAKTLSKFVKKTPSGIGLGSPWTMQLAINEAGLTKILTASIVSLLTKPFGFEGLFYRLVGRGIAAIDGPTEYSLYPSNVSAKLAPKNPQEVVEKIHQEILKGLSGPQKQNFRGVAIIDANDLGQNVLANSTELQNSQIEKIFADNPLGQGKEQTPLAVVFEL